MSIRGLYGMRRAEDAIVHDGVRIGTSGWNGHWRGGFCNNDLGGHAVTDAARLREYAGRHPD